MVVATAQPEEDLADASCHAQCHTNHCGEAALPSCCVTTMEGAPPHPADGCEERCCPCFWLDENSIEEPNPPPVPVLGWVFDPQNRLLNDNRRMRIFGAVGTRWADAHRKQLMGLALMLTVVSIPVAVLGCFGAGSNDETVVSHANWAYAWVMYNRTTSGVGCTGVSAEIGLRSIVFETCLWDDCEEGADAWKQDMSHCAVERQNWDRAARLCDGDDGAVGIFDCAAINGCHRSASGGGEWSQWVGSQQQNAYVTCFTLVFALMGCLTRIRWRQDSNFQKLIGCLPDTLTAVTGVAGLNGFVTDCYGRFDGSTYGGRDVNFSLGVGYKAFWCCWAAQVGRALIHWIVPVPGGGGGMCTFREPAHAARLLAGSGTDSYREALTRDAKGKSPARVAPSGMPLAAPASWEEPVVEYLP